MVRVSGLAGENSPATCSSPTTSLVRNVADRSAVLYLGRLQEKGPTEQVFRWPRHPYTHGLLSAIPVTSDEEEGYKPRKQPLEGEIPSPRNLPSGCRFHTRCPYATDVCREVEPGMLDTEGGVTTRCHVYDDAHADEFESVPELDPVAATRGETTDRTAGDD